MREYLHFSWFLSGEIRFAIRDLYKCKPVPQAIILNLAVDMLIFQLSATIRKDFCA